MGPRDVQCLRHILSYCEEIQAARERFGDQYASFLEDRDYQRSVSFSILQIGELSARLSPEYRRETAQDIPWKAIIGMRNIVVHDYGNVEHRIIWDTMDDGIPALRRFCADQLERPEARELLARMEGGPSA